MYRKAWEFLRKNPAGVAILISSIFALTSLALSGFSIRDDRAGAELAVQVADLEVSLDQLKVADAEGLQNLQQELDAAETKLESLRAAFPETNSAFDIYRRSFALSRISGADLVSVRRVEESSQETSEGILELNTYHLEIAAKFSNCRSFLTRIEQEGLETIALDNIFIDPAVNVCAFDVVVASGSLLGNE
jgi:hypothetical protein